MKVLIILGFLVAFLVRFIGVYPGYNNYHSDEPILYGTAVDMVRNGNLDPQRYDYPGVSIYANYLAYRFIFIPIGWVSYYFNNLNSISDGTIHIPLAPLEQKRVLQSYIFGEREINVLTWGRTIAATFSFGSVILTYYLAKKVFNKEIALISLYFIAFNFRQVLNSHVNLPDIYNSFFLLLSFIVTFNLWKNQSKKNYLLAGVCAGLSFSTKYQFFAFLPIGLVQVINSIENKKVSLKKLFDFRILISLISGILVFLVTNPYFLPNYTLASRWINDVSLKYGMGVKQINLYPLFYYYHFDLGPFETILAFFGLVVGLKKYTKVTLFFLVSLVPFFFVLNFYSRGGFYVRNYITVTPIVLIFAALSLSTLINLTRKFLKGKLPNLILVLLMPVILFIPARNVVINSYYDTKKYNYNLLTNWLFSHIPAGTVIAANAFDPPTGSPEIKKTEFELNGSYSMAEHNEDGAKYSLINMDWAGNNFYIWMFFGFNDLKYFWNKPYVIMRNTFFGVASEEMFTWQVYSVTKPWQAPDANLVLAKLPEWPTINFNLIKTYSFDNNEGWHIRGNFEGTKISNIFDDSTGHESKGSLRLEPNGGKFATTRIASDPIIIKHGYLYKIDAYLKTDKILAERERDGFIRVDFYKNLNDLEEPGMISTVSSRIYGSDEWMKKSIEDRAPEGSNYMVISLQTSDTYKITVWMDDLNIEESSSAVEDPLVKSPYINKAVDLNDLYPNSHGNL